MRDTKDMGGDMKGLWKDIAGNRDTGGDGDMGGQEERGGGDAVMSPPQCTR